jgi:hypothetical protein
MHALGMLMRRLQCDRDRSEYCCVAHAASAWRFQLAAQLCLHTSELRVQTATAGNEHA